MKKRWVGLLVAALALGALACDGDTPVTPKAQCVDGTTKVKHNSKGTQYYECHNGEWIRQPKPTTTPKPR